MNKLARCPFCGGEAELTEIGNDYTKKKQVKISCGKCRVTLTNGAIRFGMEWLKDISMKAWNTRAEGLSRAELEQTIFKALAKTWLHTRPVGFIDELVTLTAAEIIAARGGRNEIF